MDNRNFKALVSSLLAVIGFIFLPWTGSYVSSAGSMIFANTQGDFIGTVQDPQIWIVLLAIAAGLAISLWGTFKHEFGSLTSTLSFFAGLFALWYFVRDFSADSDLSSRGLGYWVTLIGCVGMVIQRLPDSNFALAWGYQQRPSDLRPMTKNQQRWTPYLFLLPGLILYAVWIIGPTLYSIYMSFLRWDFISPPVWVGLDNYRRLFDDPTFSLALGNNLRWLSAFIVIPTTLGLALAMLLNRDVFGGRVLKVGFYFPLVLSLPVIGLVWTWVFNPRMGLVNPLLIELGVEDPPGWLADRDLAIWVIIIAAIWRQVGYVMILYLAGLKAIDPELLDAAQIDGAGWWRMFRDVVFPLLRPVTSIIVVIEVIDSLRAFDLVSIMTRGGQDTQVLANFMYMETFNNYRMGYGASIAVILFLIASVFIFTYLYRVIRLEQQEA